MGGWTEQRVPGKYDGKLVRALAAELGITPQAIMSRLAKGQTPDNMREEWRLRGGLSPAAIRQQARSKKMQETGEYIPSRMRAGKMNDGRGRQVATPAPGPTPSPKISHRVGTIPPPEIQIPQVVPLPEVEFPKPNGKPVEVPLDRIESRAMAELRKAVALADERELIVRQKRGELIPLGEVNAWFANVIVTARDMLMKIAPELRDRLAAEIDPVRCEQLVDVEIRRVLGTLREMDRPKLEGRDIR